MARSVVISDVHSGRLVAILFGVATGRIEPGTAARPVTLGRWRPISNGKYEVRTTLVRDGVELPIKRDNNITRQNLYVGRGAAMPYDLYEAENGVLSGGAQVVGPNRTLGDLAGEASGRKAVTLKTTGSSVEFTTRKPTNTLVTRFSVPDAPNGGGLDETLDVSINGQFLKSIPLTSRYSWLYGPETAPGNDPELGPPRHIYDEANVLLGTTVPAGSKIKPSKGPANMSTYTIDFVSLEQVAPIANPDPTRYVVPIGYSQQDVQSAVDKVRTGITGNLVGVYLPPGDYQNTGKLKIAGTAMRVIGAGPWFTRFHAPADQQNTDAGFDVAPSASGSTFSGFAYFGNYANRIDGPGKVFDLIGVSDLIFENMWVEHRVCMLWGTDVHRVTVRDSRIRDTFADAVNLTNGSTDNHVVTTRRERPVTTASRCGPPPTWFRANRRTICSNT